MVFVQKLVSEGWVKPQYLPRLKNVLVHSLRADKVLLDLSIESKFSVDWSFLRKLHGRGHDAGREWLDANRRHLGRRSSVDLRAQFL